MVTFSISCSKKNRNVSHFIRNYWKEKKVVSSIPVSQLFLLISFSFFSIFFVGFLFIFSILFLFHFPFPFSSREFLFLPLISQITTFHVVSFFFLLSPSSFPNNHPLPISLIVFVVFLFASHRLPLHDAFLFAGFGFSSSSCVNGVFVVGFHRVDFMELIYIFIHYLVEIQAYI